MMKPTRSRESQSLKELWGEYAESVDVEDDNHDDSENPFEKKDNPFSR